MKIYSYVLRNDNGLAPNPFWDYCTLALDQPLIRQIAKVGDWVVGLKEKSPKIEDHELIFAMKITEKLTFEEYWYDDRFASKIPDFTQEEQIYQLGDNIYQPHDGEFEQVPSLHSEENFESKKEWKKQKQDDLQGKYVLISNKINFYYFGRESIKLPSVNLTDILYCDVGHKCIADPEVPKEFIDFIDQLIKNNKIGFIAPPIEWPKKDESWIQCIPKED